jgi:segregation and condensation protein B
MERPEITRAIEAIVMVADLPIPTKLLAELLEVPAADVDQACQELAAGYEVDGRGFILAKVAGGWRYQSHPELAEYVERFVLEGQSARLSAAALETLAIVAYKQPLSRAQVAAIRGVNVDGVMRTLEQRGYIDEVGRDPGPGQAVLFGTTPVFLEKLGLDSLEQLPPLSEFVPPAEVVEALEAGLRPDSEQLVRGDHPTDATDAGAPGEDERSGPAASGAGLAAASTATGASDGEPPVDADAVAPEEPAVDHLARLDETTARLDALVDEVRGRIEATEAAVAERDAADSADEPGEEPDGDVGAEGVPAAGGGDGGEQPAVSDAAVAPDGDGEPAHDGA